MNWFDWIQLGLIVAAVFLVLGLVTRIAEWLLVVTAWRLAARLKKRIRLQAFYEPSDLEDYRIYVNDPFSNRPAKAVVVTDSTGKQTLYESERVVKWQLDFHHPAEVENE